MLNKRHLGDSFGMRCLDVFVEIGLGTKGLLAFGTRISPRSRILLLDKVRVSMQFQIAGLAKHLAAHIADGVLQR